MKPVLIALFGVVLVAAVAANEAAWNLYKLEHNKYYETIEEELARKKVFQKNLNKIIEHNKRFIIGLVTYEMGLNLFSDMTDHEFKSKMHGKSIAIPKDFRSRTGGYTPSISNNTEIPKSIDWRALGAVTPVKQQGTCSSCWTFASTGALESAHYIKTGELISLSEQNLLDCVKPDETECYEGSFHYAYDYIKENGGIDTLESYPYTGKKGTCNYNAANSGATIQDYVALPYGNEETLTKAIGTVGPVTVAINADLIKNYKSGVFYDSKCSKESNHVVLAVGYGTDPIFGDYYIVKNSWGTSWGEENGYIRFARNKGNVCGIACWPGYPIV